MSRFFAAAVCLWALASPAFAAITVTAAGNHATNTGATVVLSSTSSGAADIPAGSVIVVFVSDGSTSGSSHAMTDSAGNTYTLATSQKFNNLIGAGNGYIYYSNTGNAVALTGAGTITYTKDVTGARVSISAVYVTGTSGALDSSVTATAYGHSNTPSGTSGASATAGDLFFALVAYNSTKAFTEDTGNGWALPPTDVSNAAGSQGGGNQIVSGTSSKTFTPSIGPNVADWAMLFIGFTPATANASFIFTPAVIP